MQDVSSSATPTASSSSTADGSSRTGHTKSCWPARASTTTWRADSSRSDTGRQLPRGQANDGTSGTARRAGRAHCALTESSHA